VAVPAASTSAPPTVAIDPGHDRLANTATEPIGPGSAQRKIKDGGGARGVVSGTPEAVVTLAVSLRLRALLRRAGVRVVMTRTRTAGVSLGNVARARVANRAGAALFVRIHADGSLRAPDRGTSTLVPALRRGWTDDIYRASRRAGHLIQAELVRALRSRDRGVVERSDLTGFNWADVPAVLVELGFLTNPDEDRLLTGAAYQARAAVALCRGVLRSLGRQPGACGAR
jgi:N-acetylmuramoyl-L-alanine amidase